ncbi:hypothetical protein GS399_17745 [Pedobacter sp. HMF7647]|uniref:Glycosyltransferase n=1 Tax=Hufsiella arboris TaxID=2695275 RepID=A0A7K1YFR2_9SPHI|nr:glycosyltransferase family 4 protein [Hufsiella arboris]MXV52819.1 hypothetical protein [Hufsiella arboris]
MKKVIIVSPHFPPSNLAAVHRSRLFAKHLPEFGWEPIIVTVDEAYYEEALDPNLVKLLPASLRIEKVAASSTKNIRLIGDIGIRGFRQMLKRILFLCSSEKIDFLYIPIPSNFAALLGPIISRKTGIPYGIDYIDPWVHRWPGTEKKISKAYGSMKLGEWLEPLAVKKVSLITGVAPGYYEAVLERNPHLKNKVVTASMPYGGEAEDHLMVERLGLKPYLFKKEPGTFDFVYAGAMLPKAYKPLEEVLKVLAANLKHFENIRIHFIGSGYSPNDAQSYNIKALASKYGLWESVIFEYPKRIPYLEVLTHLNASDGAFIIGSTEAHYTPSKVYQAVLSQKPVFAVLHQASSACKVIESTGAGLTLTFDGEAGLDKIGKFLLNKWTSFLAFRETFDASQINQKAFDAYSAKNVTSILADALAKAISNKPS